MARIAFVTGRGPYVKDTPERIQPDDALAAARLRDHGITVVGALWSDLTVDWASFDIVLLRSCWDYHRDFASFHRWLMQLTHAGVRILNEPELVLWNSHKAYLLELNKRGVATIPTMLLPKGDTTPLEKIAKERGWKTLVLKPAISLAGENIIRSAENGFEAMEAHRRELGRERDLLLQCFCEPIISEGEWALVFFDGVFSHSFLKRPAAGEFRVNLYLGGDYKACDAPPEVASIAEALVASISPKPLYARADMVRQDGEVLLCELELIEPGLYFGLHPPAAETFAKALISRL